MNNPRISIIAAIGPNRELGKDNKLLYHISEDLKRFKIITSGHAVIMGRKTFESLGRPLPNRTNIVISRDNGYEAPGCIVVHTLQEAFEEGRKRETNELFVIGGGQIYTQALPFAQKLYLTLVHKEANADTFFPDYGDFRTIIFRQERESQGLRFTFLELVK